MLTTRAVVGGWLGAITFIPGCVVIATFVGIVCITLWKDCVYFGKFNCCSNKEVVVIAVTFTLAAIIKFVY